MKLRKGYSPVLGCEVWHLSQKYLDRSGRPATAAASFCILDFADAYFPRRHLALRVIRARQAVRQHVAEDSHD